MEIALTIIGVLLALWLLIAASGTAPLLFLWFADFRYVSDPASDIAWAVQALGPEWLDQVGLDPEGAIRPLGISMVLFRQRNQHTSLSIYRVGMQTIIDIETSYPNGVQVASTTTPDGILMPSPPGTVLQCLPRLRTDVVWQKHVEAVQLIRTQLNATEVPIGPLDEAGAASELGRIRYLFTHPWLILTIPYRYFILKWQYRGVTIATQLDRGWINVEALNDRLRNIFS